LERFAGVDVYFILLLQQPIGVPGSVIATVNRFTDFLLQYAIALAAVGALAMTLMEVWKRIFDSRTKFLARRWILWQKEWPPDPTVSLTSASGVASADVATIQSEALGELLQLSTGVPRDEARRVARGLYDSGGQLPLFHAFAPRPAYALFALDLGRMMGSIQEAADVALAAPQQHASLYLLMTTGADAADISHWYSEADKSLADVADGNPTPEQRRQVKEQSDRFGRLRQVVKRKLDGFQLYTGDRWASRNQVQANMVGMVVMFAVLWWIRGSLPEISRSLVSMIILSLLGGVLSPIAKDLVAALKRARDG
jgi:hypothetical protein